MKNIPLILYIVIGTANVLGHFLDQPDMIIYSKPMLMPALIFFIYHQSRGYVTKRTMLVVLALIFSWLGDLALMKDGEDLYFLLGLGAFLFAQLTYTYVYYKSTFQKPIFQLMPLLPILTFTIFLLTFVLRNAPTDMQIPIVIYAICITAMACMARLRMGLTSNFSFQWVMLGSLLFVISDSAIAIDKFYRPIPYDEVVIMSTYIAAQVIIVIGISKHPD
ncbi:MAG: lysoplasmalogenase [Cytophagales bacterium]|nr:lysoplasmalogenase [Cytophagales bacterium]